MHKVKKLLITLAVIIFLLGILPSVSFSAKKINNGLTTFGVQPVTLEFNGGFTKKQSSKVLVINKSNHPINVEVTYSDFIYKNDPKRIYQYTEKSNLPVSAIPYIDVTPKKFVIPARSDKKVEISYFSDKIIKTGKYSAVLFNVRGQANSKKIAISIIGRIATNIFIVPGKGYLKREGHLNFFKSKSSIGIPFPYFKLSKSPGFVISYKNTGNTHLNLNGNILIENIFGRTVQTIELPEYSIYPYSTKDFEIPWEKNNIGFFKAKVQTNASLYDYKRLEMSKGSSFFYIPYQYIIAAFLLLVAAFVRFYLKRRKKKADQAKISEKVEPVPVSEIHDDEEDIIYVEDIIKDKKDKEIRKPEKINKATAKPKTTRPSTKTTTKKESSEPKTKSKVASKPKVAKQSTKITVKRENIKSKTETKPKTGTKTKESSKVKPKKKVDNKPKTKTEPGSKAVAKKETSKPKTSSKKTSKPKATNKQSTKAAKSETGKTGTKKTASKKAK